MRQTFHGWQRKAGVLSLLFAGVCVWVGCGPTPSAETKREFTAEDYKKLKIPPPTTMPPGAPPPPDPPDCTCEVSSWALSLKLMCLVASAAGNGCRSSAGPVGPPAYRA